jgi:hypothetical protein
VAALADCDLEAVQAGGVEQQRPGCERRDQGMLDGFYGILPGLGGR